MQGATLYYFQVTCLLVSILSFSCEKGQFDDNNANADLRDKKNKTEKMGNRRAVPSETFGRIPDGDGDPTNDNFHCAPPATDCYRPIIITKESHRSMSDLEKLNQAVNKRSIRKLANNTEVLNRLFPKVPFKWIRQIQEGKVGLFKVDKERSRSGHVQFFIGYPKRENGTIPSTLDDIDLTKRKFVWTVRKRKGQQTLPVGLEKGNEAFSK